MSDVIITRFIEFVESFKPGYASTIVPGDPDDVEELEQLLGYTLPPLYRAMLLRMGGSLGQLRAFEAQDYSLELVLWAYREPPWRLPDHFLLIGADVDIAFDYFLDLRRPSGDDYEVVSFDRSPGAPSGETQGEWYYRQFRTLREKLFYSVLSRDLVRVMPHQGALHMDIDTFENERRFGEILSRLGVRAIPEISEGHAKGYLSEDLAVAEFRHLQGGWHAMLGSHDARRLAHVMEIFFDHGFHTS